FEKIQALDQASVAVAGRGCHRSRGSTPGRCCRDAVAPRRIHIIETQMEETMNRRVLWRFAVVLLLSSTMLAVRVGESAPNFQATDSKGQAHQLSEYRGKFVVLEWHNNGCPY